MRSEIKYMQLMRRFTKRKDMSEMDEKRNRACIETVCPIC